MVSNQYVQNSDTHFFAKIRYEMNASHFNCQRLNLPGWGYSSEIPNQSKNAQDF